MRYSLIFPKNLSFHDVLRAGDENGSARIFLSYLSISRQFMGHFEWNIKFFNVLKFYPKGNWTRWWILSQTFSLRNKLSRNRNHLKKIYLYIWEFSQFFLVPNLGSFSFKCWVGFFPGFEKPKLERWTKNLCLEYNIVATSPTAWHVCVSWQYKNKIY